MFSVKDQMVNISGFAVHAVFVAASQLSCSRSKATIDSVEVNGQGCVPINLYL